VYAVTDLTAVVTAQEKPPVLTRAPAALTTLRTRPRPGTAAARLQDLAGIIDVLTDVERRADELNRRAAELVEGWL